MYMLQSWSESKVLGFVVCQIAMNCIQQDGYKEKPHRLRHHRTGTRIWIWRTFIGRLGHFCSEWQRHWWHKWHYWHKLQTADWQNKLSTYCTLSPQVYRGSKWVMTNGATLHQHRFYRRGFMKEQRLVEGPLCVCICFTLPMRKK